MVHKHHARRLHYDLRLEIDGALASWAVPKGPSHDPAVKRLAVQTEDHPLEYGAFEGRIPDGAYGAGDSLIWDRGTFDTVPTGEASRQRVKGHLHLELAGEKLRGGWHLVRTGAPRGGKAQWLLFKAADGTQKPGYDVVAERPESVVSGKVAARGPARATALRAPHPAPARLLERVFPPMLATLAADPPRDRDGWIVEPKYDGFRVLGALSGGAVALWSRGRQDLTRRFAALATALGGLVVGEAVLDGEIVVLDARGVPRFERLQGGHDDRAVLIAFDLLWLDGEDLRPQPLEARRALLESLLAHAPPSVRVVERLDGPVTAALAAAAARGHEGIVLKRRGSRYEGRRSPAWLKWKVVNTQEVAIVGFTPLAGAPASIGALLVGVVEGGALRFAGRVGTGFSAAQRAELRRTLSAEAAPVPRVAGAPSLAGATWVEPRMVARVGFREWTEDGLLRHPTFRGLRPDRLPQECGRDRPQAPLPATPSAPVVLTHPRRVLYPRDAITKQAVADYYGAVATPLLRALADRPLALEHWSDGIDRPSWFQQGLAGGAPSWLAVAETETRAGGRRVRHLLADRPEALRWLAQHAVLTIHMWASRHASLASPDWVVFDLDPAGEAGIEQAIEPALVLRALFEQLGLPSVPKTSGKRGLHILVPLEPGHTYEQAAAFARQVGAAVARTLPETVTVERAKGRRRGRLYLDCHQNGYGKTLVAPYALRALDGAPASAPLRWSEVTRHLDPSRFTLHTMPERLVQAGDLFAPALGPGARLPRLH